MIVNVIISAGLVRTKGITLWVWNCDLGKSGHIEWIFNFIPGRLGFAAWTTWELGGKPCL